MIEETAQADAGEPLPWIVAIEKPAYGDDPWFRAFCRAIAEGLLHYTTATDHEQRNE